MSLHANRLKRLHHIRTLVEAQHQMEMQDAMLRLHKVELAIKHQTEAARHAILSGANALRSGDMLNRNLEKATSEVAALSLDRLKRILLVRMEEFKQVRECYLDSYREQEQVKILVRNSANRLRQTKAKEAQAEDDEWFLRKYCE